MTDSLAASPSISRSHSKTINLSNGPAAAHVIRSHLYSCLPSCPALLPYFFSPRLKSRLRTVVVPVGSAGATARQLWQAHGMDSAWWYRNYCTDLNIDISKCSCVARKLFSLGLFFVTDTYDTVLHTSSTSVFSPKD